MAIGVAASGGRRRRRIVLTAVVFLAAGAGLWGSGVLRPSWKTLEEGRAAYARGDMPLAQRQATRALKERPKHPEALRLLARASARLGRHELARQIFDQLGPPSLQAEDYFLVGVGHFRENRYAEARTALEQAHRRDPDHPETLNELTELYAGSDRLAEATDMAQKLAKTKGWEVRGSVLLGLLRTRLEDPVGAAEALAGALKRDPSLTGVAAPAEIRRELARDLLAQGKAEDARSVLRAVLDAGPNSEAQWLLSRAELRRGDLTAAAEALPGAGDSGPVPPEQPEPAPYVGSASCAQCHGDIYRLARGSRHAKTFVPGDQLGTVHLPDHPVADPANSKVISTFTRRADGVHVETREGDRIRRALVTFAVGSGDRGLTPVGRDDKGALRELRLSYYGDIGGWDRTTGHEIDVHDFDQYLGRALSRDDERRCLGCHATTFRAARDRVGPEAADRGIGCERCHGPAGNHLLAIAAKFPDPAIGRPRLASPEQVILLCGQCHDARGRQVVPTDADAIRFQARTLTWSRCYQETRQGLSCVTCHSPHHDADTAPAHYEAKCLACHAPAAPPTPARSVLPSRHVAALPDGARRVACPKNPLGNCLECHMPTSKSSMRHTIFTDHHIRIHRDDASAVKLGE